MNWIPVCEQLDQWLHGQGVPDDIRMKAMCDVMTVMAQTARRKAQREREEQALALAARGMEAVTQRQGCHRATSYRRLDRAVARLRNSATNQV